MARHLCLLLLWIGWLHLAKGQGFLGRVDYVRVQSPSMARHYLARDTTRLEIRTDIILVYPVYSKTDKTHFSQGYFYTPTGSAGVLDTDSRVWMTMPETKTVKPIVPMPDTRTILDQSCQAHCNQANLLLANADGVYEVLWVSSIKTPYRGVAGMVSRYVHPETGKLVLSRELIRIRDGVRHIVSRMDAVSLDSSSSHQKLDWNQYRQLPYSASAADSLNRVFRAPVDQLKRRVMEDSEGD